MSKPKEQADFIEIIEQMLQVLSRTYFALPYGYVEQQEEVKKMIYKVQTFLREVNGPKPTVYEQGEGPWL